MRILTISDSPFLDTGFGSATRNICQNLPKEIEVFSIGLYDKRKDETVKISNRKVLDWTIFPCNKKEAEFIQQDYMNIVKKVNPDFILIVLDIWKARSFMNVNIPVILYAHIEAHPLPIITDTINGKINWTETMDKAYHIIVNGPFGKKTIVDRMRYVNKNVDDKITIIPNGINLDIFKPLEKKDKGVFKVKNDEFIIGFFSRMNARKGLPQLLEAFSTWKYNHLSSVYIHSAVEDYAGWDLKTLINDYGVKDKIITNNDLKIGEGYPDEILNKFYNGCDITVLPSTGESFGRTVCFPPGTLVRSSYGWVPIESIRPGMTVITHRGKHRKVTHVIRSLFKGILKGMTNEIGTVFATLNHQFFGRKNENKAYWSSLREIENDFYNYFPLMVPSEEAIKALLSKIQLSETILKGDRQALYIYSEILNYLKIYHKIVKNKLYVYKNEKITYSHIVSKTHTYIYYIARENKKIQRKRYAGPVYNLEVEDHHSYLVEGGFSAKNCESLAAGVPAIITDYSELQMYKKGVEKIPVKAFFVETNTNINRAIIDVDKLRDSFTKFFEKPNYKKEKGLDGIEEAKKYDIKKISLMWSELFDKLEKLRKKEITETIVPDAPKFKISKHKILIVSDDAQGYTGFANVARELGTRLMNKYEVAQLGWFSRANNKISVPFKVYSTASKDGNLIPQDAYADMSFDKIIEIEQPSIVLSIGDYWMIKAIANSKYRQNYDFISYMPVDGEPWPKTHEINGHLFILSQALRNPDVLVAYTEFGKRVMSEHINRDIKVISHGINTNIFKPLSIEEKKECSREIFGDFNGMKLGLIARNVPRKNWPKILEAIKILKEKYRVKFFAQTDPLDRMGFPLNILIDQFNIRENIIFSKSGRLTCGCSSEEINRMYNALDMVVYPSKGEGFGFGILESMACGIPVVTTNYSGHSEYSKDIAYYVPINDFSFETGTGIKRAEVTSEDLANTILECYNDKNKNDKILAGIKKAAELNWNTIINKWIEIIENIPNKNKSQINNYIGEYL